LSLSNAENSLSDAVTLARDGTSGRIRMRIFRDSGGEACSLASTSEIIVPDVWMKITVEYTAASNQITMQKDGVQIAGPAACSQTPGDRQVSKIYVGKSNMVADAYFKGEMKEMLVMADTTDNVLSRMCSKASWEQQRAEDLECASYPTSTGTPQQQCEAGNSLGDGYFYRYNLHRGTPQSQCGLCWCCRAQTWTSILEWAPAASAVASSSSSDSQFPESAVCGSSPRNCAEHIMDGDPGTVWHCNSAAGCRLELNLGAPTRVGGIAVLTLQDRFKTANIEISNDGTSWQPLTDCCPGWDHTIELQDPSSAEHTHFTFPTVQTQFLRLNNIVGATSGWPAISEIQLLSSGLSLPTCSTAQSSTENPPPLSTAAITTLNPGGRSYSCVWDNNYDWFAQSLLNSASGWTACAVSLGQWMQIDLGSVNTVVGIVTQKRQDHPSQYVTSVRVDGSVDGSSWYTAAAQLSNNGAGNLDFNSPVTARYIKIHVLAWVEHISMRAGVRVFGQTTTPDAANAVDGSIYTCAQTQTENSPWLRVDLEEQRPVFKVRLIGRTSGSGPGFELRVGNWPTWDMNPTCATGGSALTDGQVVDIPCEAMGRFLFVVVPGDGRSLALCDVTIKGLKDITRAIISGLTPGCAACISGIFFSALQLFQCLSCADRACCLPA
jgi:hypothetical protein